MPQPPTLKISEIFPSVQGEGLRQGEPTIFVRFAGCNLRCAFCDTKYARTGGTKITVERIAARVAAVGKKFPASWVALTGGEPLVQYLGALIRRLRTDGFRIQVETNGTIYRPWPVDWLTVSPKPRRWSYDPRFRRRADEVKLVVTKSLTPAVVARLRREFPARVPILLQPESNAAWSRARGRRLLEEALRDGLENIRVTVQLHRIYGLR
jgi:organic radical activating enzyme